MNRDVRRCWRISSIAMCANPLTFSARGSAAGARNSTMGKAREFRVNRKVLTVTSLEAPGNDLAFWKRQTPGARFQAMELLRRINYGQAACTARLKRVLEVAQLEKS